MRTTEEVAMKALRQYSMTGPHRAALAIAALAATCALPATAVVQLPFSQTAGWFMGTGTTVIYGNVLPQAGGGGFFGPLPANPAPPPNTFSTISWGCNFADSSTCAAFVAGHPADGAWPLDPNTAFLATTATDPTTFLDPARSVLVVNGNSGNLDDVNWTDVTTVKHYNRVVNGDVLSAAEVQSFLRLNGTIVDVGGGPSLTDIDFTE